MRGWSASAPREPLLQLGARDRVERGERLVEQQHRLAGEQRAGERDPLAHAAGQLVGPRGGELAEPEALEQPAAPAPGLAPPGAAAARARAPRCRAPSATAAAGRAGASGRRRQAARRPPAGPPRRPRRPIGSCRPADDLEQRGLPAAGGADEPEHLARGDLRATRLAAPPPSPRRVGNCFVSPATRHGRLGRRGACHQRLPLGSPHGHRAACSLRGHYPTGSKGQRRECRMALEALSQPACPRAPLEDLRRVYLRACIASSRSAKFSIRTTRPSRNVHTWKNRSSAYAPLMTPRPLPRTAVK